LLQFTNRQAAPSRSAAVNGIASFTSLSTAPWRRYVQRGYNQSEALARALAARLGLPCQPRWLRRTRNTPRQTVQESPTARRENMRGAFSARGRSGLAGKVVLLVDDVLTTGSTCDEAARALLQGGAAAVVVAVLARRDPRSRGA
jgi:predicted amidophosphoribosyltransferase